MTNIVITDENLIMYSGHKLSAELTKLGLFAQKVTFDNEAAKEELELLLKEKKFDTKKNIDKKKQI